MQPLRELAGELNISHTQVRFIEQMYIRRKKLKGAMTHWLNMLKIIIEDSDIGEAEKASQINRVNQYLTPGAAREASPPTSYATFLDEHRSRQAEHRHEAINEEDQEGHKAINEEEEHGEEAHEAINEAASPASTSSFMNVEERGI